MINRVCDFICLTGINVTTAVIGLQKQLKQVMLCVWMYWYNLRSAER